MPKINPTKKRRSAMTGTQQGAMKEIMGTELYHEMMQPTCAGEEEDSDVSMQEGQQISMELVSSEEEYQEEEEEEEDEEEYEYEEVEASQVLPRRSPRKKKQVVIPGTQATQQSQHDVSLPIITHKPNRTREMTQDVEDDLIDWLEANPCLYDKSMPAYKITEKKRQIFATKADSLKDVGIAITGEQLSKWFDKMCGIARKKTEKLPSGAGAQISAHRRRQVALKKKLEWLTHFVERRPGETPATPGKSKRPLASRPGNAPALFVESYSSGDDEEGPRMTSTPRRSQVTSSGSVTGTPRTSAAAAIIRAPTARSSAATSARPPSRESSARPPSRESSARPPSAQSSASKKKSSQSSAIMKQMEYYEDVCDQVIRNLDQTVMPTEARARKMFIDSMFMQVLQKLPKLLWAEFQDDFMKLISGYRKRHYDSLAASTSSHPPASRPSTSQ